MRELVPAYLRLRRQLHASMTRMLALNDELARKMGMDVNDLTQRPFPRTAIMDEFNGLKETAAQALEGMCVILKSSSSGSSVS